MNVSPSGAPVLVAAGGAGWEATALDRLARRGSAATLHKRCVDLTDLVASTSGGLARVALVSAGLPGLDADAVARLEQAGVGVVVVVDVGGDAARERLRRLGVRHLVPADLGGLDGALGDAAARRAEVDLPDVGPDLGMAQPLPPEVTGRTVVVWGPAGAPGRTTLATGIAAELAHRDRAALLLDADPYGGAVAQHLGILDGASGLLAAARAANAGELDPTRLAGLARTVGDELRVLTGLPRPDRWPEVRPRTFDEVLTAARSLTEWLVLDTGFSLEGGTADPFATGPQRNHMTVAAVTGADELVVVGAADPVGLSRLARGLVDVHDLVPDASVTVVVNRTRSSLGWSERDIHAMVEGFVRASGVHFLPDDRTAADRALMAGRSLVETGDSALRRGVSGVVDGLTGEIGAAPVPLLRRRPRAAR
jgi:MinD-like ATPase involved in chromosome partitioning or flagellar assembly